MPSQVTLKDIAAEIGVSYQTVWRAMHDKSGILPATRAQILEVANRLGYRPNRLAGGLRTRRSGAVGLVVLDVSNPYTGELTSAIEAEATAHGLSVLLMNSGDRLDREIRAVSALMERRVDGLILNPCSEGDHGYLRAQIPAGLPMVAINRSIPGVPCATVSSRHKDAAAAARYLLDRGRDRIGGIFGNFTNVPFLYRYRALRAQIAESGLAIRDRWFEVGENSVTFAREAIRRLLNQQVPPSGLFTASSRLTEGALLGLRDLGLQQGRDLDLVGFDLRYAELLEPPLPVLRQPAREMGTLAVRTLLKLIEGGQPGQVRSLPVPLVHPA